jgi:outer membrane protein, multidrug efflux system
VIARAAILAGAALLLLSGCSVGPDHRRPPFADDVPAHFAADQAAGQAPAAAAAVEPAWWTAFGDPALDGLVAGALAENLDLRRASARVLEARALLGGARSDRWPRIEVGGTASRSKSNLAAFGGRGTIYREFFEANLSTRYEVDLWGRLSRAEEAAWATLLQDEQSARVVRQTLVADVVRAWLQARELQAQLDLTRRTIASYRHTVAAVEERYRRGVAPALEVHLARQNLLGAMANEPEQERQLGEVVRRLEILAGRYPAGRALAASGTLDAPVLPAVPAGLPSSLLERRPDLLAAEAGLHAATANVGAVRARLYPTLSLTGSAGYASGELRTWFDPASDVWSLAASLVMPLVNRGATRAQARAAEARAEQALAGYRQAVLVAFAEVEGALDAVRHQAEREALLAASVREAEAAVAQAEQRYRAGLDNLLVTLEAQRRLLAARGALLVTERAHRTARVNLILALGGPWDQTAAAAGGPSEGDRE